MNKIGNFIEHLECPSINGIVFENEMIQLFDVEVSWKSPIKYNLKLSSKTSISNLQIDGQLYWNNCAILDENVDDNLTFRAVCGEGNYGSDGFVAIINLKTECLIWIAFFNCSNPFSRVEFTRTQLAATTTIGCIWKFNIYSPTDIEVLCP